MPSVLRPYKKCYASAASGLKFSIMYVYKATFKGPARPQSVKSGLKVPRSITFFYQRSRGSSYDALKKRRVLKVICASFWGSICCWEA